MPKDEIKPLHRPTKEEWVQFGGKQQWDVMVALRGPDCTHPETLKWFSTAVIRSVMSSAIRVGGTVNDDLHLIVLPAHTYPTPKVGWAWDHFTTHAVTAAHWLNIPVVYIPLSIWWEKREEQVYKFARTVQERVTEEWAKNELARHLKTGLPYAYSN